MRPNYASERITLKCVPCHSTVAATANFAIVIGDHQGGGGHPKDAFITSDSSTLIYSLSCHAANYSDRYRLSDALFIEP